MRGTTPCGSSPPRRRRAKALLALFRTPSAEAPTFRFGQEDTRFLGDLYQDLNEAVQKRYALLQTPRFVEAFILDRTLERAIERFGLDEATVIDPTCGSGHFLLGSFERLYEHRLRAEPGLGQREAARKALDAVFGADINPYAVAIAQVPPDAGVPGEGGIHQAGGSAGAAAARGVADSLLHNAQLAQSSFWSWRASRRRRGREARTRWRTRRRRGRCFIGGTPRWWGIRRTSR
jgi:hypothetical protein